MWQAFLISIWQLSAILLLISWRPKLCQVGWGQMHNFRFLQKYMTGFNPRLWPGHSRTFTELPLSHSCCVFRSIVLLEGEPSAQSEVLNALDWVFINLYWGEDLVWPHRHKAQIGGVFQWCSSVDLSYLHIWSWSSTRVTIRFLVTTLTKALLHQLLSLARRSALGKVLVVSNFFY